MYFLHLTFTFTFLAFTLKLSSRKVKNRIVISHECYQNDTQWHISAFTCIHPALRAYYSAKECKLRTIRASKIKHLKKKKDWNPIHSLRINSLI